MTKGPARKGTHMLLEKIQQDSLVARKARDGVRAKLLTTLYSEAAMVGKNDGNRVSTDEEVVKVVRKFLKGAEDTLAVITDEAQRAALTVEKGVLEGYMPNVASEADIAAATRDIIAGLAEKSPKAMGEVMKQLKQRFGAALDGNVASKVVKAQLVA